MMLSNHHKRRLYTWTSPVLKTKITLIIFIASKDGEVLYSQQKQDQELTVAQIMNSLLPNSDLNWKVGKITRSFRYDLNQMPYNYTVEMRNRFKGLDMINRYLMNYGQRFMTLYRHRDQDHPHGKEMQKKQYGCQRRPYKYLWKEEKQKTKEKRKDIPMWMQSSKEEQEEIRKPSSMISAKK